MDELSGISGSVVGHIGRVEALARQVRPVEVAVRRDSDRVEVSREARESAKTDAVRRDLVNRVRGEIEAGTYDTPERVDLAADALLLKLKSTGG